MRRTRTLALAAADQGYVAAPPARVFELLGDPATYSRWWPGVRSDGPGRLEVPALGALEVVVDGVRADVGLYCRFRARRVEGHLEWYLEPFREGTVVYCITNIWTDRRWSERRSIRLRSAIRSAMVALKGILE